VAAHEPQQLPPADQGHQQIQQDRVRGTLDGVQVVRHLLSVAGGDHVVSRALEEIGDEIAKLIIVLCDDDRWCYIHSSDSAAVGQSCQELDRNSVRRSAPSCAPRAS
jgi:hypothetical protein